MKCLKKIDFWISAILIVICSVFSLLDIFKGFDHPFLIIAYFIVGGWQAFSMVFHAYNHWFTYNKGKRYIYHWITFIAVITMPIGPFILLLFTAPVMAVYYTWICYEEAYIKMQRPLALLK